MNYLQKLLFIKTFAKENLKKYNLSCNNWKFKFLKNEGLKILGVCVHSKKTIYISPYHVKENTLEQAKDTILHEIAHALTPNCGHGKKWKAVAREIGAVPRAKTYDLESKLTKEAIEYYKYALLFIDNEAEYLDGCKRKLKRMSLRQVHNRPETFGKLFLVEIEHYVDYTNNVIDFETLKSKCFQ